MQVLGNLMCERHEHLKHLYFVCMILYVYIVYLTVFFYNKKMYEFLLKCLNF